MKNQKGFTHWVVVILISVMAVGLVGIAWYYEANKEGVNSNTNTTTTNTNAVANANDNSNTNSVTNTNIVSDSADLIQSWNWSTNDRVIYGDSQSSYWEINVNDKEPINIVPEGYTQISLGLFTSYPPGNPRLIFLERDNKIFLFDRLNNQISQTSLPALLDNGDLYESPNIMVFSTDGVEVIIQYNYYDKNSEEYHNEFYGSLPTSATHYRYDIAKNTYTNANELLGSSGSVGNYYGTFYEVWDRENSIGYNYLSGEGIGNKTPISAHYFDTDDVIESTDYGYGSKPSFNADGTKVAVPAESDNGSLIVYLYNLPNIEEPYQTLELIDLATRPTTLSWSRDNTKLAVGYNEKIYIIDILTQEVSLVFEDDTLGIAYMHWDRNNLIFSPTDNYLFFIDFDNTNQNNLRDGNNKFYINAVDVESGNLILLHEIEYSDNTMLTVLG